jgi:thioredoxin 1
MKFTDQNVEEIIKDNELVIIDFSAIWCGPCKSLEPTINELEVEYKDQVVIGKLDIEENDETTAKYGIRNIPTLLFFKNGELVDKLVGSTTKEKIVEKINLLK